MKIIDVSGHNNNCGLYSLALAVSLAISEKGTRPNSVPEYIAAIGEQDVSSNAPLRLRNELARKLRNDLADALKGSPKFKTEYLHKCIQVCINHTIESEAYMEAFIGSNKTFIEELHNQLVELDSINRDLLINDALNKKTVIPAIELQKFMQELLSLISTTVISRESINSFIASEYAYSNIYSMFRFCKMFAICLQKISITTENVGSVKDLLEVWFFEEAGKLYATAKNKDKLDALVALGLCRMYMEGVKDLIDNVKEVYVRMCINERWDELYDNYAEYVRNNRVMLSSDELGCLSSQWNTELKITHQESQYTQPPLLSPDLSVSLSNINRNHWQVISEYTDLKSDSAEEPASRPAESDHVNNPDINIAYKYTDKDVQFILDKRLAQLKLKNPGLFENIVKPYVSENTKSLEKILYAFKALSLSGKERSLLIQCKVDSVDWHEDWFGIFIKLNDNGSIVRAVCLDSLRIDDNSPRAVAVRESIKQAKKLVLNLYGEYDWDCKPRLTELDEYSSGVYVIENLLLAFSNQDAPKDDINPGSLGYRAHHAQMLLNLGFKKEATRLCNKLEANNSINDVNLKYSYGQEDISAILRSRIYDLEVESPEKLVKTVYGMSAICSSNKKNNLELMLEDEKNLKLGERILLLACKLEFKAVACWLGISLYFNTHGELVSAILQDSASTVTPRVIEEIQKNIANVHKNCVLELDECLQQKDDASSGTYLIENLLRSAQDLGVGEDPGSEALRRRDLISLKNNMPQFYRKFIERQWDTKKADGAQQSDIAGVPSERQSAAISDLFMALGVLSANLDNLFADNRTDKVAMDLTTLKSHFHTVVNNETGNLELQLNEAVKSLGLEKSLKLKYWKNDKLGMLLSNKLIFAPPIVSVVGGGGVYAAIVMGAGEAVEVAEAVAITEGVVQVGAGSFLVPILGGVVLIISAGLMTSGYLSRVFAHKVHEALKAYHVKDSSELKIHKENLEFELGLVASGRSRVFQKLRWCTTSNDLYYLAKVLLAQIWLKNNEPKSFGLFNEVLENTTNATLKAMCLIGQIEILSHKKNLAISINDPNLTADKRQILLNEKVQRLNTSYPETVKQYFDTVRGAYATMLKMTEERSFLKSVEEFAVLRSEIDRIIQFKDLYVLKYLKTHGQIAQVVFVFAQALAYAMLEEHDKKCKSIIRGQTAESDHTSNYSHMVVGKLNEYNLLMDEFGLKSNPDNPNVYDLVFETTAKYRSEYLERYRKVNIKKSALHVEMIGKEKISQAVTFGFRQQEADNKVSNAFRNSVNESAAEISTKSALNKKPFLS